ncbi:hypothetical protein [Chitinophaga pinensis]|uniref:Uncharacterized protein n=1 Tax=Chitinophaga pinensis TaxID=79329 RepID=A0A5C6LNZ5_9BACT|nr:hypothetical protein [Chitinophaga pinensis]TWV96882.1 hypothetical protein FEF09_22595 [Chitinophaga pinensis]
MLKRVIYLPFLIGMAQLPVISKAQLTKEKSEKRIVINSNTIRVADLLGIFARETDLEFSFNSKKLSPSKVIAVAHHEQTLSAWLKELELSTGIHVKVKGDHIILQDTPPVVNSVAADDLSPAGYKGRRSVGTRTVDEKGNRNDILAGNSGKRQAITEKEHTSSGVAANNKFVAGRKRSRPEADTAADGEEPLAEFYASYETDSLASDQSGAKNETASDNSVYVRENRSLSDLLSEVLSKTELRRIPAHEMPAPDKHVTLTANKTVVYPKDTTAVARGVIADSTRKKAPSLRTVTRLDLGLQGVGISLEVPVSSKYTIEFSGGLGGGYDLSDGSFSYDWGLLNPCAYLSANGRYYYNRDKRAAKGKSLVLNAGDYFGLRLKYTSAEITGGGSVSDAILANIHWGMQRPIGRKWVINGHAGIGWAYNAVNSIDPAGGKVYPAAEFKISYALNSKRHL